MSSRHRAKRQRLAGVYVYKQALNVVARAVALQLNAYAVVHMCDVVAEVAESFGEASTHPSIDLSNLRRMKVRVVLLQFHAVED